MMGSQRQHSVYHFGPSLRKPSIRKGPSKLKKRCLEQLKRTQEFFRVSMTNTYNHANERGDGNVAKRAQQSKVATKKTLQIPIKEPSHAKVVSQPNVLLCSLLPNKGTISPQENVDKSKPSLSRTIEKNTMASPFRAMPNNGIDSSQKNISKSKPSSFMSNIGGASRPKNDMGSSAKNVESFSRLNNSEAPQPKNTKMSRSSYSRPNDKMASQLTNIEKFSPFSLGSNCESGPLARNIEKSRPSWPRGQFAPVLKDSSNSTFAISKKSYRPSMVCNSRKEDHWMGKEASNSSIALKGKQVMQDIRPNLEINWVSVSSKSLSSQQTAEPSCMVDSLDRCIQLDSRKWKTSLSENGRTDEYKSKNQRMKPLLEKLEAHVDDDSEVDNCMLKKQRRRYEEEHNGYENVACDVRGIARLTKSMGNSIQLNNKNTSLAEDERTVADKFKKNMIELFPKHKLETCEDGSSEETENCSQTKRRRRYIVDDDEDDEDGDQYLTSVKCFFVGLTTQSHIEVSHLFGSECLKLHHYCPLPIDELIWSGIIKIDSRNFVSLAAHLSTKYCEEVWKLSRSLQPMVEVTKISRLEAWPKSFEASRPTDNNIALYFLPTEMRQDVDLDQLVKEVTENDMVLRAIVGEAEMLIFPSTLLPEQHQTFQGKPYLWAVFKRRTDKVAIVEEQQNAKGPCAHDKGKQQTSHFSVGKEGHGVAGLNMDVGLEACEEAEIQGMEKDQNPSLARPNAPCPATPDPTVVAAMSANHRYIDSSLAAPTGALFGFVAQRTPRLEQLIQEMQREGVVMVAMRGEMVGSDLGLGRQ